MLDNVAPLNKGAPKRTLPYHTPMSDLPKPRGCRRWVFDLQIALACTPFIAASSRSDRGVVACR